MGHSKFMIGIVTLTLILSVTLSAQVRTIGAQEITFPKIDMKTPPLDWRGHKRGMLDSLTLTYDERSKITRVDLRGYDLSDMDLRQSSNDLLCADFDDLTVWPPSERMPERFYVRRIRDLGMNPGLGVRCLHAQAITGKGVGIAIIDCPILTGHREYGDRLRLYENINYPSWSGAGMHGCAVTSIAAGKTVGVAPEAEIYYLACQVGTFDGPGKFHYDFSHTAKAVRRILEINDQLPSDRKIRVISMSFGWESFQDGYGEMTAAVNEAREAGMFPVFSYVTEEYPYKFQGIGRNPFDDPDSGSSYVPGLWWSNRPGMYDILPGCLLVPMDTRTTASPTGDDHYVYYRDGGWSWAIPWIAGMYALACQADPSVTPDRFWQTALETGTFNDCKRPDGTWFKLGPIIDSIKLIEGLKK